MELWREYFIPWIISNSIAILLLISAIHKPKLARLLLVLLFIWACLINYSTAHNNPNDYLNYAALTPFHVYVDFINGWFKSNIVTMVTVISIGQGLIAAGMLLKGWIVRLAGIGAIVFLLAITPLGIGSGFPFTLITALSIYIILKKDDLNYLWYFKTKN